MKTRTAAAVIAACVIITAGGIAAESKASPSATTATGTCYNGATWTMKATRSGDTLRATFSAKPMGNLAWNVNSAWTPQNTVGNMQAVPRKGAISVNFTSRSAQRSTLYVWVDTANAAVFTCIAAITI